MVGIVEKFKEVRNYIYIVLIICYVNLGYWLVLNVVWDLIIYFDWVIG